METVETANATEEIIKRAIEYLRRKIRVHQAILFGSQVRGVADRWSDIDLAVISPDFAQMKQERVMDLLVEVALAVDPSLEIRPYTPRDLKDARPTSFLGHILTEGRAVYKNGEFIPLDEKEYFSPPQRGRARERVKAK